ncbi:TonB-dependent receptor [Sphingomonas sp. GC_Shp_3]|uniref:TonB-dependent receptor domain-containing protein n=1 Tax=Sphingomonas sp. GC_Shp_3 TaxID=2937383 RepID=UPI00226A3021|nr:TonB-dependent receptor [Sphingomonas sp. GC_Shp_3]
MQQPSRLAKIHLSVAVSALALIGAGMPIAAHAQNAGGTPDQRCADGSAATTDAPCPTTPLPASATPAPEAAAGDDVVVTGSRIRGPFTTDSPVTFITKAETSLAGSRNIAEVLQDSGVTSGTAQINNTFLGYVSQGGAGANTVGLLGLGAQRTLVLLNGRRLSPAGVGPQLVAADLNVLPNAVLDHVEVLKNGASSVYGSDAVGGVINLITDSKINGVTLDAYGNVPLDSSGAGSNYRLSVTAGKTFDRGHILASFEYRDQTGIALGNRKDMSCPTDLLTSPTTGQPIGQLNPNGVGLRCFPFANGAIGTAQNYLLGINYGTGAINRYGYVNGNINTIANVNNTNARASASQRQLDEEFYSPIRTYTGYLNGSYELGILGDAEIYGEGLFTRRESSQIGTTQISIDPNQLGFEIYGGAYPNEPSSSPFFPNSLAAAGNSAARVFIVPRTVRARQTVNYYRGNIGLRGNVGIGDIRYDANYQYSRTEGTSITQNIDTRRITASLLPVLAPNGTPAQYVTTALAGQAGAGASYTCASNLTNGAYNGGTCVAADFLNPSALAGNLPSGLLNYLYSDQVNRTTFTEQIAQIVFDGSLFNLPGGPVGFAVGGEWRSDSIDDVPSEASQSGNLYNYSSSGRTKGTSDVYEAFGEVKLPLLKDLPFAHRLDISGSARYTHSQNYGNSTTYHASGNWAPAKFLTIRGNYGTSFRAPNLYEQFVANQSGFSTSNDPCRDFTTIYATDSNRYKNCLSDLTGAIGATKALAYIPSSSPEVFTGGGGRNLKAEKSTSWGAGFVLDPKVPYGRLQFTADYLNTTVNGEIDQLGDTIFTRCFDSADFRNGNPYCALVGPRETKQGNLTTLQNIYLNIAQQKISEVDMNLRYQFEAGGFNNVLNVTATRIIHQKYQPYAEEPAEDYVGTLGLAGFVGGPKWVGNARLQVQKNNVTVFYGVKYVGPMKNEIDTPAIVNGVQAISKLATTKYFTHDISVQVDIQKLGQFTFGMKNFTDRKPETISSTDNIYRQANYFNYSGYDFIGRSLFMEIVRKF